MSSINSLMKENTSEIQDFGAQAIKGEPPISSCSLTQGPTNCLNSEVENMQPLGQGSFHDLLAPRISMLEQPGFKDELGSDRKRSDSLKSRSDLNTTNHQGIDISEKRLSDRLLTFYDQDGRSATPDYKTSETSCKASDRSAAGSKLIKQEPEPPLPHLSKRKYCEEASSESNDSMIEDLKEGDTEDSKFKPQLAIFKVPSTQYSLGISANDLIRLGKIGKKSKSITKTYQLDYHTQEHSSTMKPKKRPGKEERFQNPLKRKAQHTTRRAMKGIGPNEEVVDYDPIQAYHAQDPWAAAPSIEANTKKKQLDDMLAGCPKDSHMPTNRIDKENIHRATKAFGNRKVTAADGFWKLDGMRAGQTISIMKVITPFC